MFKKFASIAMAAAMVVGTAAFSASAAEIEDATVGADIDSSAVAADENSETVGADQGSETTGSGKTISFDVNSAKWGNGVKAVYCHIFRNPSVPADGKKYTSWQLKEEKCEYDKSTGIATYDLQTGIDKGADGLSTINEKNEWVVMFSANTGAETYHLVFNSNCYGDTVVADPNTKYENTEDSEKSAIKISYKKNSNITAPKAITSTGKVQGSTLVEGSTDASLLADYLFKYATDDKKVSKDKLTPILKELGIKASDAYSIAVDKINADDGTNYADDAAKKKAIAALDNVIKELEGEAPTYVKPSNSGSNGGSGSNGSGSNGSGSNGGSGSNSSSGSKSSGSGSGSVSSGQETTIFYVFGGVVIAAAGVMFLARKKRQF